jgi:signal transduction histidine kinase
MRSGSLGSRTATQPARIGVPALLAIGAAGALLSGLAVGVALTGDMPDKVALAERHALMVATPIAVGLYAWRDGTHARFGRLLLVAGAGSFLAALSSSSDEVLYSLGRVAAWGLEAGVIYLVLAFPSGRLTTRIDRWLALAALGIIAILFLPTAFMTEAYPTPSPYASCDADCPGNAFIVLGSEPSFVDDFVIPLRELLAGAVLVAVVVRLAERIRRATRVMRRTLVPVLAFAIVRTLALAAGVGLRGTGADDEVVLTASAVVALGLPAICVGFMIGLVRWRIYLADSLLGLARGIPGLEDQAQRRDLIAATVSDPTVELAFRSAERGVGWIDSDGRPTRLPPPSSDRHATLIFDGDEPVAAVVHDAALSEQRSFIEAVGAYAFVWDDNRRLAARVESSLTELRESRARILAAADEERRRIERDLHDGGQQRLVALRIRLELAEEVMRNDPARAQSMIRRLGGEVDATLDELRSLAAGVYPALLTARGLPDALRTAALQSPIPASVDVDGSDRYSDEIETAAYFCCIEALQNVAKHAPHASSISISLSRNGDLRFEVRDDGAGFVVEDVAPGDGLMNMRDRIGAVGGRLDIRSRPGAGTTVSGDIPVAPG